MPLRISLLLFFCFKMLMGFGFSVMPFTDSTTGKKHQLTREAFLNRYGTDDSSRALIHYFFDKRQVAQKKPSLVQVLQRVQVFYLPCL